MSSSATAVKAQQRGQSRKDARRKKQCISALANGDYSSVKIQQNAAGHQLVFNDKGLVLCGPWLYGASLTDYGTAFGGVVYGSETGGFLLEFIQKVSSLRIKKFQDSSDASQDRLWTGVGDE